MRRFYIFLLCAFASVSSLSGQAEEPASDLTGNQTEALGSLLTALNSVEGEVEDLRRQLATTVTDTDRERLERQLSQRSDQLEELERRFQESAAGVDLALFEEEEQEPFSWEQTLGKILEPILDEVEKATATSRKRGDLRSELEQFSERAEAARSALDRIRETLLQVEGEELRSALEKEQALWEDRLLLADNRAQAAALQLEQLESGREGVLSETTSFIRSFLANRGLNLLIGIVAALLVFFGLRLLLSLIQKLRRGDGTDSFGSRIFLLLTNILSIVGAITALLIAFSAAGDLFLLGLVLVFLIGAAWAGIQVIPQFIESLKIILNIGMVRENERILFDGVPWHVQSLGFSCILTNEVLDSAKQVLPVRRLVGLHSRPWCSDELAFPCRRGEWVELSDGSIGQSVIQNPGTVSLREWGGSEKTFQTVDFLAQSPRNLSRKGFQVVSGFGIDYAHQAICSDAVPGWFEEALKEKLTTMLGADQIEQIRVLFADAAASSLDYEIRIDLKGSAAERYRDIKYEIQRILVETCNERDLTIPFQQLTLHRAE